MKKADLVNEMAKATLIKKEAAEAMEIFLGTIKKTLKKRDKVFISGLGTFGIVKRKARTGRNPKTGEAAKFTPRLKPSRAFKEVVK